MTHTPGPWTADGHFIEATSDRTIAFLCDDATDDDARLIAAAPELLEALERIVKETATSHVTKAAKAAIAKARGVTE